MNNPGSNIEGIKKAVGVGFRKHMTDYDTEIIAIPIAYKTEENYYRYETAELTSVCPVSGLPDFYTCIIELKPKELVPELKTLKFYFMSFRDVGILHEDLAPKIMHDIADKIDPEAIRVTLRTNIRGGIGSTIITELGATYRLPEVIFE